MSNMSAVVAFGASSDGQLGSIATKETESSVCMEIPLGIKVLMVSAGSRHTLLLTTHGVVYSFGWGVLGQLGLGTFTSVTAPTKVDALTDKQIVTVSAGGMHSACVDASHRLYTWGSNEYGQLGQLLVDESAHSNNSDQIVLTTCSSSTPMRFEKLAAVPKLVYHVSVESRSVTPDSDEQAQGSNRETGNIGNSRTRRTTTFSRQPTMPKNKAHPGEGQQTLYLVHRTPLLVSQIACGGMHTGAIDTVGRVWCWGRADNGQIGYSTTELTTSNYFHHSHHHEGAAAPLAAPTKPYSAFQEAQSAAVDAAVRQHGADNAYDESGNINYDVEGLLEGLALQAGADYSSGHHHHHHPRTALPSMSSASGLLVPVPYQVKIHPYYCRSAAPSAPSSMPSSPTVGTNSKHYVARVTAGHVKHGPAADVPPPPPPSMHEQQHRWSHAPAASTASTSSSLSTTTAMDYVGGNESGTANMETSPTDNVQLAQQYLTHTKAVSIACGSFHTAIADEHGVAYSMGKDDFGMLGTGINKVSKSYLSAGTDRPTVIEKLLGVAKIVKVACGGWHSMFLSDTGMLYTCGRGEYGRLGLGDETSHSVPVVVNIPYANHNNHGITGLSNMSTNNIKKLLNATNGTNHNNDYQSQVFSVTSDVDLADAEMKIAQEQYSNSANSMNASFAHLGKSAGGTAMMFECAVDISAGGSHSMVLSNYGNVYSCGRCNNGRLGELVVQAKDKPDGANNSSNRGGGSVLDRLRVSSSGSKGPDRVRTFHQVDVHAYCEAAAVHGANHAVTGNHQATAVQNTAPAVTSSGHLSLSNAPSPRKYSMAPINGGMTGPPLQRDCSFPLAAVAPSKPLCQVRGISAGGCHSLIVIEQQSSGEDADSGATGIATTAPSAFVGSNRAAKGANPSPATLPVFPSFSPKRPRDGASQAAAGKHAQFQHPAHHCETSSTSSGTSSSASGDPYVFHAPVPTATKCPALMQISVEALEQFSRYEKYFATISGSGGIGNITVVQVSNADTKGGPASGTTTTVESQQKAHSNSLLSPPPPLSLQF